MSVKRSLSANDRKRLDEVKARSKKENSVSHTLASLFNNMVAGMAITIFILVVSTGIYMYKNSKFIVSVEQRQIVIAQGIPNIVIWAMIIGITYTSLLTIIANADEETAIARLLFKFGKESQQHRINALQNELIQLKSSAAVHKYDYDDLELIKESILDAINMYDACVDGRNIGRDSYMKTAQLTRARWQRAKQLLLDSHAVNQNHELLLANRDKVIHNIKTIVKQQRD